MRFSIEQNFLTDYTGRPISQKPAAAFHLVEAETLDAALATFLNDQQAQVIGSVQHFAGWEAIATAQQEQTVFTLHILPASDAFRRTQRMRTGALDLPASPPDSDEVKR